MQREASATILEALARIYVARTDTYIKAMHAYNSTRRIGLMSASQLNEARKAAQLMKAAAQAHEEARTELLQQFGKTVRMMEASDEPLATRSMHNKGN